MVNSKLQQLFEKAFQFVACFRQPFRARSLSCRSRYCSVPECDSREKQVGLALCLQMRNPCRNSRWFVFASSCRLTTSSHRSCLKNTTWSFEMPFFSRENRSFEFWHGLCFWFMTNQINEANTRNNRCQNITISALKSMSMKRKKKNFIKSVKQSQFNLEIRWCCFCFRWSCFY